MTKEKSLESKHHCPRFDQALEEDYLGSDHSNRYAMGLRKEVGPYNETWPEFMVISYCPFCGKEL